MAKHKLFMVAAIAVATAAHAGEHQALNVLLPRLVQFHDRCSDMAQKAHDKYALAQYKSGLDLETGQNKARLDAQLYGIGHGGRETRDYYLERSQEELEKNMQADKQIKAEYESAKRSVQACVQTSETEIRHAYAGLKESKGIKRADLEEAEDLVTAWLANMDEISPDTPQGSESNAARWKAAKARAELRSSL